MTDDINMEKNGKMIPINQTLVLLYMFALLDQYDIAFDLKQTYEIDPYRDKIIMKTDDDKYIEIPQEMQKYAIQQWTDMKDKKPSYKQEYKAILDDDTDDDKACRSCRKERKREDHTVIDTSFQLILCLLIIFTILYTLSLLRQCVLKI
jgi:hypothetical protein